MQLPRSCLLAGVALGSLTLALSQQSPTYTPISGFDRNRENFYLHEALIAAEQNAKVQAPSPTDFRVGHFDAHWHGLKTDEYIKLADAMQTTILVARGMPEREGDEAAVRATLSKHGFHQSSIVQAPSALLPSGLVIGSRGIVLDSTGYDTLKADGGIAAIQVVARLPLPKSKTTRAWYILVATLDPVDATRRQSQLAVIYRRMQTLHANHERFILIGGFHTDVFDTRNEMGVIHRSGSGQEVFELKGKIKPLYTSWTGHVCDTAFISHAARSDISQVNIWHTGNADNLPVLVDLGHVEEWRASSITSTSTGGSKWKELIRQAKEFLKGFDWPLIGGITMAVGALVVLLLLIRRERARRAYLAKIQATATWSSADLKLASPPTKIVHSSEDYPDEKHP